MRRFFSFLAVFTITTSSFGVLLPVEKVKADSLYKLPYPYGVSRVMTGGNNPNNEGHHGHTYSHYAFDFAMPVGSDVVAARGGVVKSLKEDSTVGECDISKDDYANYVVINHEDGSSALYMHLQNNGVLVTQGQRVRRGQLIAKSGQTGYVCGANGGAHLHYSVQTNCAQNRSCPSIPNSFSDPNVLSQNPNGIPTYSNTYTSSNKLVSFSAIPLTSRVAPVDYNGNGNIDILGIRQDGQIHTMESEGSGFNNYQNALGNAFAPNSGWYPNTFHTRVWVADVDGDGNTDLLAIADDGRIFTSKSNGDGTYQGQTEVGGSAFSPNGTWFRTNIHPRVWPVDLDGNGKASLLAITDAGDIWVSKQNGNGSFANPGDSGADGFAPNGTWFRNDIHPRVWPADVTGDGKTDILGIADDGRIFVAKSLGNGAFEGETFSGGSGFDPNGGWFTKTIRNRVWPTDVDGDDDVDILGIANDGRIFTAISNGDGTFQNMQTNGAIAFAPNSNWFTTSFQPRVWPADINGDGASDIVGIADDGDIYFSLSYGGNFIGQTDSTGNGFAPNVGWFTTGVHPKVFVTDYNGDGKQDLVGVGNDGKVYTSKALNTDGYFENMQYSGGDGFAPNDGWFAIL